MAKAKIRAKEIRKMGLDNDTHIGLLLERIKKGFRYDPKEIALEKVALFLENPDSYLEDEVFGPVARKMLAHRSIQFSLNENPVPIAIFGESQIDENTRLQMETALRLPIARKGALMPDAHVGYGLPIGGVLATKNAIIPYAVGVDIACRMSLSIFPIDASIIDQKREWLAEGIYKQSKFGREAFKKVLGDPIIDDPAFGETPLLKRLKKKARIQLGSSGSGNHFVEFGSLKIEEDGLIEGVEKGSYLALLTHSGSRGLGANIADYYTQQAMKICELPRPAKHLAWLDMKGDLGQEYWLSMQLAGRYAKACHDQIHRRISDFLGVNALANIENHHNFAWKELGDDGEEWIVHRKGATPAKIGELGIIPGSMATPGFVVSGKGNPDSLFSASHGAGRKLSRSQARKTINEKTLRALLKSKSITLMGGDLDEAPGAYKDIHEVMAEQKDQVNILARFDPQIVRMDRK